MRGDVDSKIEFPVNASSSSMRASIALVNRSFVQLPARPMRTAANYGKPGATGASYILRPVFRETVYRGDLSPPRCRAAATQTLRKRGSRLRHFHLSSLRVSRLRIRCAVDDRTAIRLLLLLFIAAMNSARDALSALCNHRGADAARTPVNKLSIARPTRLPLNYAFKIHSRDNARR
jgi:hypothetical protein